VRFGFLLDQKSRGTLAEIACGILTVSWCHWLNRLRQRSASQALSTIQTIWDVVISPKARKSSNKMSP
jgi:hypothetical protein